MNTVESYCPQKPGFLYKASLHTMGRPDPETCAASLNNLAKAVADRQVSAMDLAQHADLVQFEVEGALRSEKLPASYKALLGAMGNVPQAEQESYSNQTRLESARVMKDLLTSQFGFRETARGSLGVDEQHEFEMSYGSDGGFRGSHSYEHPGATHVMTVTVLQRPGAGPNDPAAVAIDYTQPAFLEPHTIPNTSLDGKSSANTLYLVDRLAAVDGLGAVTGQPEKIVPGQQCQAIAEKLVGSLDKASPVQFHLFSMGYGRVGTSYFSTIQAGTHEISGPGDDAAGLLLGLYGVSEVLHVPQK